MEIGRERRPNATVLRLTGELDLATAPEVLAAVEAATCDGGPSRLVLDMSGVSFIDSTGVRTLLEANRVAGNDLSLLAPSPAVTRVLELTELRGHLNEIADLDAVS
ncbi:MAG: STAS domain-containing protein [Thermoleophilia bacterium]|nr:STAS domain-containing protein [Thermoleophilia bacterium]